MNRPTNPGSAALSLPSAPVVVAVVVTYHPDPAVLTRLLTALASQVASCVVVDNGSEGREPPWGTACRAVGAQLLLLPANLGVAAAQNRGIAWARDHQADAVVLFDQDSEPASDLVARLVAALAGLRAAGEPVAAVGPRYLDPRFPHADPFVRIAGWRVERLGCDHPGQRVAVDHLIASGCLIPLVVLDQVGEMQEELFIDYVDTEWALRAVAAGFRLFGVCDARMVHRLGESQVGCRGRLVPGRAPLRNYYLFRNGIWLFRQPGLSWGWRLAILRRLALTAGFFLLFAPQRWSHLFMMGRGVRHALKGELGPLPW